MLLFVVTCSALRPLFIPSRSQGPSAAQFSTSASTPPPVGYPLPRAICGRAHALCFDNDPFCLVHNPFLLITIWIAYVWNVCSGRRMSPLFHALSREPKCNSNLFNRLRTLASLFCRSVQAISFFLNGLRTLYKKHPGVPQLFFITRRASEGPQRESARARRSSLFFTSLLRYF